MKNILLFLSTLFACFTIQAQVPVAEYHFSDGSLEDASLSGFDLIQVGNVIPITDRNGDAMQAMYFNEGNLDAGNNDVLNMNEPITIAVWVKVDTFNGEWTAVLNKWNGNSGSYYLGINPDNMSMRWNAFVANVEDPNPIEIGSWMHYAAVYDGQFLKIYKNGEVAAFENVGEIYGSNDLPVKMGSQSNVPNNNFNGSMDDIYIFKAALSDGQINELYNGTLNAPDTDLGVIDLNMPPVQIANVTTQVGGKIYNYGANVVNSFDLKITDGVSETSVSYDNLSLPQLEAFFFDETLDFGIPVGDTRFITVTIENVNGADDDVSDNDSRSEVVRSYAFLPKRKMVIEEGTGTWCGWCPRGAVALDNLTEQYPDDFIGIAVHFGDTMQLEEYTDGTQFTGYPSCHVDRTLIGVDISPEAAEDYYQTRVKSAGNIPMASLDHSTSFNTSTNAISITVDIEAATILRGSYKLAAVITEDMVTGTTEDFSQSNFYAGGVNGPMGGYETLPDIVPYSKMEYDHVARALIGGYDGIEGLLPNEIPYSQPLSASFEGTVPELVNPENAHVVTLLLAPNGSIVNAQSTPLLDGEITGTKDLSLSKSFKVYPNPSYDLAFIEVDIEKTEDIQVSIFDLQGRQVLNKFYSSVQGRQVLPIKAPNDVSGIYLLKVRIGESEQTKKLVFK